MRRRRDGRRRLATLNILRSEEVGMLVKNCFSVRGVVVERMR